MSLGKGLVETHQLADSTDTLGRWMSHYVAELIKKAESATGTKQASLQKECADVIIDLWAHRSSYPKAPRPLDSYEKVMNALLKLRGEERFYYSEPNEDEDISVGDNVSKWLKLATNVDLVAQRLVQCCIDQSIKSATDLEAKWLDQALKSGAPIDHQLDAILQMIEFDTIPDDKNTDKRRKEEIAKLKKVFRDFGRTCQRIATDIN